MASCRSGNRAHDLTKDAGLDDDDDDDDATDDPPLFPDDPQDLLIAKVSSSSSDGNSSSDDVLSASFGFNWKRKNTVEVLAPKLVSLTATDSHSLFLSLSLSFPLFSSHFHSFFSTPSLTLFSTSPPLLLGAFTTCDIDFTALMLVLMWL